MYKAIFHNFLYLILAALIGKGLYLLAVIVGARYLGPEQWGIFAYAFTILAFVYLVSDFGFHTLIMRDVASSNISRASLHRIIHIRATLGLLASAIALLYLINLAASDKALWVFIILSLSIPFRAYYATARSAVQGAEQGKWTVHLDGVLFGAFFLVTLVGMYSGYVFPLVLSIAWLVASGCCAYVSQRALKCVQVSSENREVSESSAMSLLHQALPFVLINALVVTFHRIDVLMIESMRTLEEVGYYVASYQLFDALALLPGLMVTALFPRMAKGAMGDSKALIHIIVIVVGVTGAAALGLYYFSEPVIQLIYGGEFRSSSEVLRILLLGLPFMAGTMTIAHFLFSSHREKYSAMATGIAVISNILLNIYWIPIGGIVAAAWVTSATLVLNFLLHVIMLRLLKRDSYEG